MDKRVIWNYYTDIDGTNKAQLCKFCHRSFRKNVRIMEEHLARCDEASPDVNTLFLHVSELKRASKALLLATVSPDGWKKLEEISHLDVSSRTEADLADIEQWNRQKQMQDNNPTENMTFSEDEDDDADWNTRRETLRATHNQIPIKSDPTFVFHSVAAQERRTSLGNPSKTENIGSIHQITPACSLSLNSQQAGGHSPLQTKILQEQLLERRARKKIAELELQRKALELERYQWEYERDKARSYELWLHETRMMQLKEEREQKRINETSCDTK